LNPERRSDPTTNAWLSNQQMRTHLQLPRSKLAARDTRLIGRVVVAV
jgi:hypothetical protein